MRNSLKNHYDRNHFPVQNTKILGLVPTFLFDITSLTKAVLRSMSIKLCIAQCPAVVQHLFAFLPSINPFKSR